MISYLMKTYSYLLRVGLLILTNILMDNITEFKNLTKYLLRDEDRLPNLDSIYELKSNLEKINIKKKRSWIRLCYKTSNTLLESINDKIKKGVNKVYIEKTPPNIQSHVFGYIKGKWIVWNATKHLHSKIIIKIDIANFFDSITKDQIKEALLQYDLSEYLSQFLAEFTTIDNKLITWCSFSPMISNIVFSEIDELIIKKLDKDRKDIRYTRYADDLAFSSKNNLKDTEVLKLRIDIREILNSKGFEINSSKNKIYTRKKAQYVTGLTCNDNEKPRIPRRIKRNFRLENYYIAKFSKEQHEQNSLQTRFASWLEWRRSRIFKIEWDKYKQSIERIYAKFRN